MLYSYEVKISMKRASLAVEEHEVMRVPEYESLQCLGGVLRQHNEFLKYSCVFLLVPRLIKYTVGDCFTETQRDAYVALNKKQDGQSIVPADENDLL